jgi:tight adherence protein C
MEQVLPYILVGLLSLASIAFIWFGLNDRLAGGQRLARRLFGLPAGAATADGGTIAGPAPSRNRLIAEDGALQKFAKFLTPEEEGRTSRIRARLAKAGYRTESAVRVYFACKWGIAIAGFIFGALVFSLTMDPAQPMLPLSATLIVVALSFFATDMWVERKIAYRRTAIEKGFPDSLDLLLVCIEAGHGIDQGLARVANEIVKSSPELAQEMSIVVAQLRAGREREHVLADFAERTGVLDISSFVTVLRQADQFGVSIGDTLRVYASEMRNKRFMRAEEKANMMPVKLALGAILFTVPPTIIVLIGPSIIMIVREMAKAASGGG